MMIAIKYTNETKTKKMSGESSVFYDYFMFIQDILHIILLLLILILYQTFIMICRILIIQYTPGLIFEIIED
jgi:hypothetical protein